jgi:hypothetical protein
MLDVEHPVMHITRILWSKEFELLGVSVRIVIYILPEELCRSSTHNVGVQHTYVITVTL